MAKNRAPGWNRLARQRLRLAKLQDEACCMCGEAVDYTVNGNHRMGPTIEHYNPISIGGAQLVPIEELGVAHRKCNSSQGGRLRSRQNQLRVIQGEGQGTRARRADTGVPRDQQRARNADILRVNKDATEGEPKFFSDPHPDAVHTLGPEWGAWLLESQGFTLRPWQQRVFDRALEVDAEGNLVWREVVVSTPRQVGKSYLIRAIASARCHFAERFGEPQECLHIANNVAAARRIHARVWRWAEQNDVRVYRAYGDERMIWPNDSIWAIASTRAIWGWTASMALADEAWDIEPHVIDSALTPILVEREQPQLWLLSTANEDCTPLMLQHRRRGLAGKSMIAEWGAPDGADRHDPETWRLASPHWTKQRAVMVAEQEGVTGFNEQWLNIWPSTEAVGVWGEGWPQQPDLDPAKLRSGVLMGAVEVAFDRSCYGVAVVVADGGRVHVMSKVFELEVEALDFLRAHKPSAVIAGATIANRFMGPWMLQYGNTKATASATPVLSALIRNMRVHHNHDPEVQKHLTNAVVNPMEGGVSLTARRSKSAIPAAKAIAWASAAALEDWFGYSTAVAIY